jgi:acetoin utilization deacetylase AcuC-like enzyme
LQGNHVENESRIKLPIDKLASPPDSLLNRLVLIPHRYVTPAEIELVHTPNYARQLARTANMSSPNLLLLGDTFRDVYFCSQSYEAAKLAAGGALVCAESVWTGKSPTGEVVHNAFAIVRYAERRNYLKLYYSIHLSQ